MNKQIFRLFAFIAIIGFAFTSCQKEEANFEPDSQINEEREMVSFWDTNPDLLYPQDGNDFNQIKDTMVEVSGVMLKSITIRNQIWTNVDNESVFDLFGYFYNNGYFFLKPDVEALDGFHVPTQQDIELLVQNLNGYIARIPAYLNLSSGAMISYDGVNYTWDASTADEISFWSDSHVTTPSQPYNIYESIVIKNGSLFYAQTSKFYAKKVRLVKNL